jgi:hypothetical protein
LIEALIDFGEDENIEDDVYDQGNVYDGSSTSNSCFFSDSGSKGNRLA